MRVLFYNVTSRGKITSVFARKDTHMPVSFALPFGEKKEDEESNERRTVGNTSTATENREQRETVGTAFGKIWECYCAFCSRFLYSLYEYRTDLFIVLSLSLSNAITMKITAPRFQLTRYYRYGEMDNCEEFWEDFYKSIENHTGKPLPTRRSKSGSSENDIEDIEKKKNKKGQFLSSLKTKCETFLTKTKEKEEENTREEEREARAFARAWQIMDPNEAKVSWRKRYRDLLATEESGGVSVLSTNNNNNEDKDKESPR